MALSAGYHVFWCRSDGAHSSWLCLDLIGVTLGMLGCYATGIGLALAEYQVDLTPAPRLPYPGAPENEREGWVRSLFMTPTLELRPKRLYSFTIFQFWRRFYLTVCFLLVVTTILTPLHSEYTHTKVSHYHHLRPQFCHKRSLSHFPVQLASPRSVCHRWHLRFPSHCTLDCSRLGHGPCWRKRLFSYKTKLTQRS